MNRVRPRGAGFATVVVIAVSSAEGQVAVAANAGLFSAYVWRGTTYTNNMVIQPDVSVTVPVGGSSVAAGLWANIEPGRYDEFSDISESSGVSSFDVAEVNWIGD